MTSTGAQSNEHVRKTTTLKKCKPHKTDRHMLQSHPAALKKSKIHNHKKDLFRKITKFDRPIAFHKLTSFLLCSFFMSDSPVTLFVYSNKFFCHLPSSVEIVLLKNFILQLFRSTSCRLVAVSILSFQGTCDIYIAT